MKIEIEPYNKDWVLQFAKIKDELVLLLKDLNPIIEHFGSTSIPGMAAKPVIDIIIGIPDISKFERLVKRILENKSFIYLEAFNTLVPKRRMFIRLKDETNTEAFEEIYTKLEDIPHDRLNSCRIAHVHVWEYESEDWIRHIAFREYLKAHTDVQLKYENLKKVLSYKDWRHGMEYNEGKDKFIKVEEKKAISWYLKQIKMRQED